MQRYVGLPGHDRVYDAGQARDMHAYNAFGRIEQNLRRQCIGRRARLVATNRHTLAYRDRIDAQVRETVAIPEYFGIRPDFHDNVVMKVCATVRG